MNTSNIQRSRFKAQRSATRQPGGSLVLSIEGAQLFVERGMALVITLILLAVITFLAITFLVISRRETGAVTTATDQAVARLAADAALQRAEAQALTTILANRNSQLFDLLVSTNYINRLGYNTAQPLGQVWPTNVNYEYNNVGTPLDASRSRQNIGNLLYDPRAPVFIRTNDNPNAPLDFRFYLDLNRNGRFDTNGLLPVLGANGFPILTNGVEMSNYFVGDPEWIGVLEKPDQPHSPSNRFVARYAFVAVPEGKTLDVNYIHNQALNTALTLNNDGFLRNQGVGTWEINLPAFLCDLNTNFWDPNGAPYLYRRPTGTANSGRAFEDAFSILSYRYNGSYMNLMPAGNLFTNSAIPFRTDGIDQYSDGPLYTLMQLPDNDNTAIGWAGADNPSHLFTIQDFLNMAKLPAGFADRLAQAGESDSSYDRYSYYRMLSQLGTDSGPEPLKINVNYVNAIAYTSDDNVVTNLAVVPDLTTNLDAWRPAQFFTLAADNMLRAYTTNWFASDRRDFVATFNVNHPFGITNIPVVVSNRFVYAPSVQRLLQVAANIYDATTNNTLNANPPLPAFPSVFRPVFQKGASNDLFVVGYEEIAGIQDSSDPVLALPVEAADLATNSMPAGSIMHSNVYNVPWIIGAKEGLPNFNELGMQNTISAARRLEFRRLNWLNGDPDSADNPVAYTNQLYTVGISNVFGIEAWNSYVTAYPRELQMFAQNEVSIEFSLTNSENLSLGYEIRTNAISVSQMPINASTWRGITNDVNGNVVIPPASFMVPLSRNFTFFETNIAYQQSFSFDGVPANRQTAGNSYPFPLMKATLGNRMRYILLDDSVSPWRVVDYVSVSEEQQPVDVTQMLMDGATRNVPDHSAGGGWATNRPFNSVSPNDPTVGILNQIMASSDDNPVNWKSYTYDAAAGNDKEKAVRFFKYQFLPTDQGSDLYKTNIFFAPWIPSRSVYQQIRWEANDPLVHYTVSELTDLETPNQAWVSASGAAQREYNTFRAVNDRYQPWAAGRKGQRSDKPADYNLANKDPLVYQSDDWDFPTNKLPNIGWLGRVHRGTPWQTIYMKSSDVDRAQDNKLWRDWTGDADIADSIRTRPVEDRMLFDLFTTAPNANAARGQLSVNQSGLAAWSAVLSGVVTLTNAMTEAPLPGEPPTVAPDIIDPAGPAGPNSPVGQIVEGINRTRADTNLFPQKVFTSLGDILAVPELSVASPFLNHNVVDMDLAGINDLMYERIPQQIMSLLRLGEPRFVIYAYGQALKPAPNSIYVADRSFFRLCTNYQVTAESATRAVVRVEDYPQRGLTNATPHLVLENFNVLGPD